jgi:hypothetical protein
MQLCLEKPPVSTDWSGFDIMKNTNSSLDPELEPTQLGVVVRQLNTRTQVVGGDRAAAGTSNDTKRG